MSALGQKQTFAVQQRMSALPPIADMCGALAYVRFVPIADTTVSATVQSAANTLGLVPIRSGAKVGELP